MELMNPDTTGPSPNPEMGLATAATSAAAHAKALVEAKFTIAMHRPRNEDDARLRILAACKRPRFAETAMYSKPVGGGKITGLSIRFAETALQAWRNVDVSAVTVHEDREKRVVQIYVTDLEANITYADEATLSKTVERKQPREGQEVISRRENSYGEMVYKVVASEDEMMTKLNAAKSKSIRNSGLRLLPRDVLEEAEEQIKNTMYQGGQDPDADKKKLCDGFATIRVKPSDLEKYLGHSLDTVSPQELAELRGIFTAIRDGETTWQACLDASPGQDDVPMGDTPAKKPQGKGTQSLKDKVKGQGSDPEPKPKAAKKKASKKKVAPKPDPEPEPPAEAPEPENPAPDDGPTDMEAQDPDPEHQDAEAGTEPLPECYAVIDDGLDCFEAANLQGLVSYVSIWQTAFNEQGISTEFLDEGVNVVTDIPVDIAEFLVTSKESPSLPDYLNSFRQGNLDI